MNLIKGAHVGTLATDSSNVVSLITGIYKVIVWNVGNTGFLLACHMLYYQTVLFDILW